MTLSAIPGALAARSDLPSLAGGKPAEAATQFEALLLSQILRDARESSGGGAFGGGDEGSSAIAEFAEEQVARAMAQSGGLGLASLIESGLAREEADARAEKSRPAATPDLSR
ncbi:MAG: hypothetical protein R2729_15795 [Bryobacteraceae bacterium]